MKSISLVFLQLYLVLFITHHKPRNLQILQFGVLFCLKSWFLPLQLFGIRIKYLSFQIRLYTWINIKIIHWKIYSNLAWIRTNSWMKWHSISQNKSASNFIYDERASLFETLRRFDNESIIQMRKCRSHNKHHDATLFCNG